MSMINQCQYSKLSAEENPSWNTAKKTEENNEEKIQKKKTVLKEEKAYEEIWRHSIWRLYQRKTKKRYRRRKCAEEEENLKKKKRGYISVFIQYWRSWSAINAEEIEMKEGKSAKKKKAAKKPLTSKKYFVWKYMWLS